VQFRGLRGLAEHGGIGRLSTICQRDLR